MFIIDIIVISILITRIRKEKKLESRMKLFALLLVGVLIAGTFAVEDIVPAAKDVSKAEEPFAS